MKENSKPKYKDWIVAVSIKSIMIKRDGQDIVAVNNTGLVIIDTDRQTVHRAISIEGYRRKKKID